MSEDKNVIPDAGSVWTMTDAEFKRELSKAWAEGHEAGRDYQGDGWNADSHSPDEDNPYRSQT